MNRKLASQKMLDLLNRLHIYIFNYPLSNQLRHFLNNLSWSFFGMGITSVIVVAINTIGGRLIGPQEYGQYNLITSLSQVLMYFFLFGLDSSNIHYISITPCQKEKQRNISGTFLFVTINSIILSFLILISQKTLTPILSISNQTLNLVVTFSFIYALRNILDSSIRALKFFKHQSLFRLIEITVTALIFSIVFAVLQSRNYLSLTLSILSGPTILIFLYFKKLKIDLLGSQFKHIKKQLQYGRILFMGNILGAIIGQTDKFIIAKFLSFNQLGIYSAYYNSSSIITISLAQIFTNVFFPTISQIRDQNIILKKLNKIFLIISLPMILFIGTIVFCLIKIYGNKYPVSSSYIIGFSLISYIQFVLSILHYIIVSISKVAFGQYLKKTFLLSLLYLSGYFLLKITNQMSINNILILIFLYGATTVYLQNKIIKKTYVKLGT